MRPHENDLLSKRLLNSHRYHLPTNHSLHHNVDIIMSSLENIGSFYVSVFHPLGINKAQL